MLFFALVGVCNSNVWRIDRVIGLCHFPIHEILLQVYPRDFDAVVIPILLKRRQVWVGHGMATQELPHSKISVPYPGPRLHYIHMKDLCQDVLIYQASTLLSPGSPPSFFFTQASLLCLQNPAHVKPCDLSAAVAMNFIVF